MSFRVVMLLLLLLAQPLAAFELNCGMGMDLGSLASDSSEHCAGHSGVDHKQNSDDQPGHTMAGGHCQSCASGTLLIPAATRLDSTLVATVTELPQPLHAPQFQSGPLYRPPIR